ncbi:helix-turn-helix domain-containing protein [Algoriphagus sp.]|uniref:helix-turn-helix domain-containing protein n=1 Tax=Algoriphagus sp. TaxID=1872435 RepID=UPI002607D5A9|nr:helix-turn-helix domain-containing protein [Algoriphagus sp.]
MNLIKIFLIIWFLAMITHVSAQSWHTKNRVWDSLYQSRRLDLAEQWIERLPQNSEIQKAENLLLLAKTHFRQSHLSSSKILLDSLLQNYGESLNPILTIEYHMIKGSLFMKEFREAEAFSQFLLVDSLSHIQNHYSKNQLNALLNIGSLVQRSNENQPRDSLQEKISYFQEATALALKHQDSSGYFDSRNFWLSHLMGKGKLDSIVPLIQESIDFFSKKNLLGLLQDSYWSLANFYEYEGEIKQAEDTFLKILSLNSSTSSPLNQKARGHWVYANFLARQNRMVEAISQFELAETMFRSEPVWDIGPLTGTTYNLALLYRQAGQFEKAFDYLQETWNRQDSIHLAAERQRYQELEVRYQNAKKEQEILSLKAENMAQSQSQRISLAIFLSIIILMIALGIVWYWRQQQKIRWAQKISELDTIKREFFENISHEFRTPLTLIQGPTEVLLRDPNLPPVALDNLNLIQKHSTRMLELVEQILALNQLENSLIPILKTPQELDLLLRSEATPYHLKSAEQQIEWIENLDVPKGLWLVDRDLLLKVLHNLWGNAVKFTPTHGKITWEAKLIQDQTLSLKVSNSAPEFNPQQIQKLFSRYHQIDSNQPGFGIGLALVKSIITRQGGEIFAKFNSQVLTIGFTLPLQKAYTDPTAIPQSTLPVPLPDAEFSKILVVEDHEDTRFLIAQVLAKQYLLNFAVNGKEGMEKALSEVPDLILIDLKLPDFDGISLCDKIKSHELISHIPVIILTASGVASNHKVSFGFGADDFFTKPIDTELLLSRIENLIQSRKLLRDRYSRELILKPIELAINPAEEKFIHRLGLITKEALENPSFSADDFAQAMNLSRMQLHRKLKHLFGKSTMEYLKEQRLMTASNLLLQSDLPISEVAYAVGYNDLSHFSKSFKSFFGKSPSEFQKISK